MNLLLSQFDDIQEDVNPQQEVDDENPAELNLTFFLYILKDVLEHTGFYPSITPQRQLQSSLYKFEIFTAKSQDLSRVLAQFE